MGEVGGDGQEGEGGGLAGEDISQGHCEEGTALGAIDPRQTAQHTVYMVKHDTQHHGVTTLQFWASEEKRFYLVI